MQSITALVGTILLVTFTLRVNAYGFDGGAPSAAACPPKASRRGRALLLAAIPCDLTGQTYCNEPGAQYPWHAVRRFVHENQGLMKRMYGDVKHISVLRNEMDSANEIDADDVAETRERYSRSGWKKNKYLYGDYNFKSNDVLTEPYFRPTTTSTTTSTTTTTVTPTTTTTSATEQNEPRSDYPLPTSTVSESFTADEAVQDGTNTARPLFGNFTIPPAFVAATVGNKSEMPVTISTTLRLFAPAKVTPSLEYDDDDEEDQNVDEDDEDDINDGVVDLNDRDSSTGTTSSDTIGSTTTSSKTDFRTTTSLDSSVSTQVNEDNDDDGDEVVADSNVPTLPTLDSLISKETTPKRGRPQVQQQQSENAGGSGGPLPLESQQHFFKDAAHKEPPPAQSSGSGGNIMVTPPNARGVNACPVKEEVVAPFWANNTRGEVLALLNLYPFEQYVHWEKCTNELKQMWCRDGCRCEQQFRLHRLLAYDPHNECRGIFSDWFRFPSCCICKCYDIPLEYRMTSRSPRDMLLDDGPPRPKPKQPKQRRHPVDVAQEAVKRAAYEHVVGAEDWYQRRRQVGGKESARDGKLLVDDEDEQSDDEML